MTATDAPAVAVDAAALRQHGIQLPGPLYTAAAVHRSSTVENPCLIQGDIDWATHIDMGAFSVFYGGRLAKRPLGGTARLPATP